MDRDSNLSSEVERRPVLLLVHRWSPDVLKYPGLLILIAIGFTSLPGITFGAGEEPALAIVSETSARMRKPSALALSEDGRWLYVANRDSGSLSVIDTIHVVRKVEYEVGQGLVDLIALADGRLVGLDEKARQLLVLHAEGPDLKVKQRLQVDRDPVQLRASADGRLGFLASTWSRRLTILNLEAGQGGDAKVIGSVDLPFCPLALLEVEGEGGAKVLVGEAFGGRIAVVDLTSQTLESIREIPGHNLRALALSADGQRVLIAQQVLIPNARTDLNNIHWGAFITNNLRALSLSSLLDPAADPLRDGLFYQLGDVGRGAADPSAIAVIGPDRVALALGGVGEIVVGPEHATNLHRVTTGKRPSALLAAPDDRRLYVANAFSDSITIIDPKDGQRLGEVSLGPQPEASRARLGEELFFNARLAHDGWMSCHSCHTDGHTNNLLVDTLGDDTYGAPKRTPSLLGTGATGPWAWDGSMPSLQAQILKSIETTMRGYKPTNAQADAIATYLRTLSPPPAPPIVDPALKADPDSIVRGAEIFQERGCQRCHAPPEFTTPMTFEVGFIDEQGQSEFNPPSLLGVGQRDRFLHDGRARSLQEVFETFGHPNSSRMSDGERSDLIAYLNSL